MITGTLKVSPEKLISTSQEFSSNGSTISSLTSEMLSQVAALSSTWQGEAATQYLTKFKSLENDIQLLNRMIQEHVTDLQEMANQYSTAEQQNQEEASALRTNIIS